MATQGILKYDTIGDGNCAYYSMGDAISDQINSGYKINKTPKELIVSAMRQIVVSSAIDYSRRQVGDNPADHDTLNFLTQCVL